ncbi:hypothetical protein BDR07DRAFT_1280054 [Suillus spraguei]|nr:hypothetical protein BDR07DRAFT_1280054 [Suillus spraguei]
MYQNTRKNILSDHSDIVKLILTNLCSLRTVGVALDTLRCQGIILAWLQHSIPEIFKHVAKDGSCFRCTEKWVKQFLTDHLNWSFRRATRAAQKLPPNVKQVLLDQFLCLALTIRDCAIFDATFLVNIDQTNIIYQPLNTSTFEVTGSKQVAVLRQEEKRAFTIVNGISAKGHVLPLQLIYKGKSSCSLPSKSTPQYEKAMQQKFKISYSNTHTYWLLRLYSKVERPEGLWPQFVHCAPFSSNAPYFREKLYV